MNLCVFYRLSKHQFLEALGQRVQGRRRGDRLLPARRAEHRRPPGKPAEPQGRQLRARLQGRRGPASSDLEHHSEVHAGPTRGADGRWRGVLPLITSADFFVVLYCAVAVR